MVPEYEHYPLSPEEQFAHPMEVIIPGATGHDEIMKVYDVIPLEPKSDVPVMMVPGWTGTAEGMRENILTMAEKYRRRTLIVDAPRGITPGKFPAGYPPVEARSGAALMKAIELKQLDHVDAVSHSKGGIFLVGAATVYPEKFRNLVLVSPPGLMGKDGWLRLLTSFSRDIYEQYSRLKHDPKGMTKLKQVFRQIIDALKTDPDITISGVQAIIRSHLEPLLINLKEQGHGIIIISPIDDLEFPTKRMAGSVIRPGDEKNLAITKPGIVTKDMVHGLWSVSGFKDQQGNRVKGHHNIMFEQPEQFSGIIDQALTLLENQPK